MMIENIDKINRPQRLAPIILNKIKDLIKSGEIKVGDKLPSEKELSDAFGVGRTSVREALQALEFSEIIVTKKGVGRFLVKISPPEEDILSTWVEATSFYKLMEARKLFEIAIIKLAVERATEETIQKMQELIDKMSKQKADLDDFYETELKFHQTIFETCDNEIITELMTTITNRIFRDEEEKTKISTFKNTESAIETCKKLKNAFAASDSDRAADLIEYHLEEVLEAYKSEVNVK